MTPDTNAGGSVSDQRPTPDTVGYIPTTPDEWVRGEYHYTGLEDNAAFRDLLARHGLEYAGSLTCEECGGGPATPNIWKRPDGTLKLATGNNPATGDKDPGYLSYVWVSGEFAFAKPLWDDIAESCTYNKGMFRPLAPADTVTDDIPESNWPNRTADQEGYCNPDYDPVDDVTMAGDDDTPTIEIPEGATLESGSGMRATVVAATEDTVTVHGDGATRELERRAIENEIHTGRTRIIERDATVEEDDE